MKSLIRLFVTRFVASISIFGALVLFGLVAYFELGIEFFPEISIPVVAVSTPYAGAGPEEVAQEVTEPIEDALATLPGVNSITSTSSEGLSVVVINFNNSADQDQAAVDVGQRLDTILNNLPSDADTPIVQKFDPSDEPILDIAVSAPGVSLTELQQYVDDNVTPVLQRVEGIADVSLVGEVDRQFQVLLNPDQLDAYNLSPAQVANAIRASATDLPIGSLDVANGRILLTGRNTPESLEAVSSISVDSERGIEVSDVATVRDSSEDLESFSRVDGEQVVLLEAQKTSGGNSVAAANSVERALEELELPQGYSAEVVSDTTEFTEAVVSDTLVEIAIAVAAVGLTMLFFVGRLGTLLGVILAIPISIMGAFIAFFLLGFTFNLMTLLAITVAVGLVVDDSIVVAENVDRYRDRDPKEGVVVGAAEVSTPVLASTLALLAVFLPISFLPGVIGDFFATFGLSMVAMISFSYLAAIFFLPMLLAYIPNPLPPGWRDLPRALGRTGRDARWGLTLYRRIWFWVLMVAVAAALYTQLGLIWLLGLLAVPFILVAARYLGRIILYLLGAVALSIYRVGNAITNVTRDAYVASLRGVLTRPWVVLVVAALLFSSLVFVAPRIGFNFTPPDDSGLLSATVELPTGVNLDESNAVAAEVERALLNDPLVETLQTTVGASDQNGVSGPGRIAFSIQLVGKDERSRTTNEYAVVYQQRIEEALANSPEADISVQAGDAGGGPPPSDVYTLTLASNDFSQLQEREPDVIRYLESVPYLRNVSSSLESTVSEQVFMLNRAQLTGTGLSATDVYSTLRAYNVGTEAAQVRSGGEDIPIQVQVNPRFVRDEQALISLPIFAPGLESRVPISSLGRFESRAAPTTLSRSNQTYSVNFEANLIPGAPPLLTVRNEMEEGLRAEGLIGGEVDIGDDGELDLVGDLATYGPIAFGLALLLTYLVIATQFNSFRFPVYLLLTVPLALIGVFWTFFFTGTSFDIISVLGVIMLIGLVVKNAILLLDVLFEQLREGERTSLKEALLEAGRLRFRPIVMTAVTVVIISAPLLLGLGEGAEFRQPLGLVILAGVLTSSLLTFYVVPAAFYQFERGNFEGEGADTAERPRTPVVATPRTPRPQTAESKS